MKILLREVHVVGPDYAHAYVWVAPVLMNPKRCEVIETFVAKVRGVTQTGCGGDHKTLTALRVRRRQPASPPRGQP